VPGIHFLETLEDYLSKYKRFYNLDIKIQREAEQHYFEFPDEVGVQLIRTIQEALINIRKHAQVNEALIRLGRTGTEVWITIEDKGRGFVASKLKNESVTSFGIQIMQERIEKVGGRLEIHSVPNQGTQISLYYDKGQGGLNNQEPA
jgi:signal transduction histidine kinase